MTNEEKNTTAPEVLMLMGTQCTYCGPMMQMLTEFIKLGQISELRIVNIEHAADLASELGVRSVPWLRIGPFELAGSRTKQELQLWIQRASSFDGVSEYLVEVLTEGNINNARKLIHDYPQALENVIDLMADPEAKINIRLGAGVIIEEMAESESFKTVIPRLLEYLSNDDARIRGDACHYLSLTRDRSYIPDIEKLLTDDSAEVREIAQDSLDELGE
ncbi:MAG: HEAT repeat domain-containing protein [Gammaproteobacteria bacterium]|nr:HEAT repeat domain-containing protein [Gammaproteobacteria bacterium]MBT8134831.1 HEAT repeat domain-containing protein [Gammaproteobacteria bacterium]NNJ50454.1 HEAT repeat domain-containing protein [Gammaproteobacteria bacterium]